MNISEVLDQLRAALVRRLSRIENKVDHIPHTLYVNEATGDDSQPGTWSQPLRTHTAAEAKAEQSSEPVRILITR